MANIFFLVLAVSWQVPALTWAQGIDDLIVSATESADEFGILNDLNASYIRQELDMILSIRQWRSLQGLSDTGSVLHDPFSMLRKKRKAIRSQTYRWPNGVIPYRETYVFDGNDRYQLQLARQEWEKFTCISFRQATSRDRNHVVFDNGGGCYSYVGMTGGGQKIGLAKGCRQKGVIVHEIGHAVGFHHEQNRPDRDNHVTILTQNIPQSVRYNFKKYPSSAVATMGVPYDYGSIMHYGGRAFSHNGQYTIRTKNPNDQHKIGNRKGLSFYDIKLANLMYKCNSKCGRKTCPGHGFVGKDCECWCPGNPIRRCGGTSGTTKKPFVTTATPRTTKAPSGCTNMNQNCDDWAEAGYCRRNTYVKTYCKKACNLCNDGTTTPEKCTDVNKYCSHWARRGYCTGIYETFMTESCAKTCKVCISRTDLGDIDHGDLGVMTSPNLAATIFTSVVVLLYQSPVA